MLVGKSVNWVGQCTKYELFFPKVHFFLILQLCLASVFNFFLLSDLKDNFSQISGKIRFFFKNPIFFGKNRIFSGKYRNFPIFRQKIGDFSPKFFQSIFSMDFFFSTPTENRKIGRNFRFFFPWLEVTLRASLRKGTLGYCGHAPVLNRWEFE